MSNRARFRFLTFRLWSLFVLTSIVALGRIFYTRTQKMERICAELHEQRCPAIYSNSKSPHEYESYSFLTYSVGGPPPNEIHWRGFALAVVGAWEFNRFTV